MKNSRVLLTVLVVLIAILPGCATIEPFSGESVDLAIEHMLHAVSEAIKISDSRSTSVSDLELSQIAVTLTTIGERTTSDDFTLWVVSFDSSRETERTQTITVTLKPQDNDQKAPAMKEQDITSPHPEMVKALAKGFDDAYLATRGASEGVARSGKTFETSSVSVTIAFTVIGSADASPTIEILGVDLTGGETDTRENVHQVAMTFSKKSS